MGTLTPVVGRQSARRRRRWTDTSAQNPVAWLRHRLVRRSPADSWIVFAWFSVSVLWCGHSAAATIHVRRVSSSPVTGSSPGRTPCSDSQTRFILEQPSPTATLYYIRVLPRHRNVFRLLSPMRTYMVFRDCLPPSGPYGAPVPAPCIKRPLKCGPNEFGPHHFCPLP